MKFDNEIEIFIRDYVKNLNDEPPSIFAGAKLSIPAGFVNCTRFSVISHNTVLHTQGKSD